MRLKCGTYIADNRRHHRGDGRAGRDIGVGRVDDTEHTLLAMGRYTAVEEGRVGIVDDLREDEALVLHARRESMIGSLVAKLELRRLGHGVVLGTPDELDGVTDGGVDGEGHVTEDTLGGGNDDGVGRASAAGAVVAAVVGVGAVGRRGRVRRGGSAEGGNAF